MGGDGAQGCGETGSRAGEQGLQPKRTAEAGGHQVGVSWPQGSQLKPYSWPGRCSQKGPDPWGQGPGLLGGGDSQGSEDRWGWGRALPLRTLWGTGWRLSQTEVRTHRFPHALPSNVLQGWSTGARPQPPWLQQGVPAGISQTLLRVGADVGVGGSPII